MGALDIHRQAPNVARMKMLGAEVRAAQSGVKPLKMPPTKLSVTGSITPDTHYIIGSVWAHTHIQIWWPVSNL